MKVKVIDLEGAALDWAVATCEGYYSIAIDTDIDGTKRVNYGGMYPEYSTDWAQGGPIIEREDISVMREIQSGRVEWGAWTPAPIRDDA